MGNTPSSTPSSTPLPPDQPTTEAPTRAPVATHQLARNRRKSDAQFAALGQTTSTPSIDAIDLALDQSGTSSVAPSTDDLFGHGSGGSGGSGPPRLPPGPASSALKPILNTSAPLNPTPALSTASPGNLLQQLQDQQQQQPSSRPPTPSTAFNFIGLALSRTATTDSTASALSSIASPYGSLDVDSCIAKLLDARTRKPSKSFCLKNSTVISICQRVREVFMDQPILLEIDAPVNLVGDVHGQYEDLLRIFDRCGYPPAANYLFLGDYVDRGKFSLETILLLFCYKLKYPLNFFILRGNHECASVNRVYGFYDECKRRCNLKIWKVFTDVFNTLPIAAIVAGKIFCVHGGLSPSLISMDYIRAIPRPSEVPEFGLLNDLLWSDPSATAVDWEDNDRGVSYCFGPKIVKEFTQKHNLDLVARAHMVVEGGYEFFADRQLVTVFSAPNYCGEFDNKGAVMCVDEALLCSFEIIEPQFTKRVGGARRTSQHFKGAGGGNSTSSTSTSTSEPHSSATNSAAAT